MGLTVSILPLLLLLEVDNCVDNSGYSTVLQYFLNLFYDLFNDMPVLKCFWLCTMSECESSANVLQSMAFCHSVSYQGLLMSLI